MAKRCLILGSAHCLWDDVERAQRLGTFDGVVAAKGAGIHWKGPLDAWVSLHPERFVNDIATREGLGYPAANRTYGYKPGVGYSHWTNYKFESQRRSGSSGLFACKVAIDLGFDRLVLCGIPLDKEQGRIDDQKDRWSGASSFKQGFQEAMPHLRDTARSMSGWTQMQLGEPTPDWFNS